MTADTIRRVYGQSRLAQAAAKQATRDRDDAEMLRWIAAQRPISIDLADGRCIDIANNPDGFWAALEQARASAKEDSTND